MPNIPILILASGAGSRFKGIKQLAQIDGLPMIKRVVNTALRTRAGDVVVILGAHFEEIEQVITGMPVAIVINRNWQSGMAQSIRVGVEYVEEHFPNVRALLIALGDQPFIEASDFDIMVGIHLGHPNKIVCAGYNDIRGVPAIFPKSEWHNLLQLSGDKGARELLRASNDVIVVDLQEAATDIDHATDLD